MFKNTSLFMSGEKCPIEAMRVAVLPRGLFNSHENHILVYVAPKTYLSLAV